jgi:hypothetical protein
MARLRLPVIDQHVERGKQLARKGSRLLKTYIEHSFSEEWFTPVEIPHVSMETTNVCNAKCVFCANPVMKRRKQMLNIDLFKKAVDEAVAYGVTDLDFNVTIGDPLLDKKLLERARYVRKHPQIQVLGFVTTLQWLHLFDIDEFMESGITWLAISITLSGRQTYKDFFGVDCYDQVLENLFTLIEANEKRGNRMNLMFSIKPTNEPIGAVADHPDFKRVCERLKRDLTGDVQAMGAYVEDWGGAVKLPDYLNRRPLVPRWHRPCRMLYTTIMVYSNGNVGPFN